MEVDELKNFVLDYFRINNAKVLESGKHVTVQVPKRISDKLNCEPILNITFNKQYAEKNEDIDFVAVGSSLLNRIIEASGKRGLTTAKCYSGEEFTGLELNFKITFESIDKEERLLSFLVDLKDKKIRNDLLNELKVKELSECTSIAIASSDLEKCYDVCLKEIDIMVSSDVKKIQDKLEKALEKEKRIIEKFYDGIISDLRKKQEEKIRIWKDKKKKAHHSQYVEVREKYRKEVEKHEEKILEIQESNYEELNNYFQIKDRRIREIENQYKLKTRVLLYSAALVMVK